MRRRRQARASAPRRAALQSAYRGAKMVQHVRPGSGSRSRARASSGARARGGTMPGSNLSFWRRVGVFRGHEARDRCAQFCLPPMRPARLPASARTTRTSETASPRRPSRGCALLVRASSGVTSLHPCLYAQFSSPSGEADRVTSLPGMPAGNAPSQLYSGAWKTTATLAALRSCVGWARTGAALPSWPGWLVGQPGRAGSSGLLDSATRR